MMRCPAVKYVVRARPALVVGLLTIGARATLIAGALAAQGEALRPAGHDTIPIIAAGEIARYLAALAADSVAAAGADTAAARLEPGARYVAEQFEKLGLRPGPFTGNALGLWYQDYPLPGGRTLDIDTTAVMIATFLRKGDGALLDEQGVEIRQAVRLSIAAAAPLIRGAVREGLNGRYLGPGFLPRRPKPLIVAGPHTLATAARVVVHGKVVFYVPPAGLDATLEQQIVDTLARGSKGVVVVTAEDSARFAARQRRIPRPMPVIDEYLTAATPPPAWVVYVRADTVARLFALAGLDLVRLRRAGAPGAHESLPLSAWIEVPPLFGPSPRPTAMNVVGLIEGSDSLLKQQYVLVAAPLPSPEVRAAAGSNADSAAAQSTSRVSGVAALLAMARAFTAAGAQPRRSIVFAAVGGTERQFAGAEFVAWRLASQRTRAPTVTLDRIGRYAGDSVAVDGLQELEVTPPLAWAVAPYAGAQLTVVSGSVLSAPCAAQCAFVRRNMPSLYVHDPRFGIDRALPVGRPATPDPAHTARVAQLTFDVVRALANADRVARWSTGARERLRLSDDGD